jgi:glycosyltransferase involved in cell wall biosynthesis
MIRADPIMSKLKITFVLPGDHRSGGVRVTMLMANELLRRGLKVRIACLEDHVPIWKRMARRMRRLGRDQQHVGWLHEYDGKVEPVRNLKDLNYSQGEVVIAVGTYVVGRVRALTAPEVIKVRFNHGMPSVLSAENLAAWQGSMPTITVSHTLIPKLEELSGEKVLAVIPNGIDLSQYYADSSVKRLGIGAVFNPHPNKDSGLMIKVLREAHARMPEVPQVVFSTEKRPPGLEHVEFVRYPSVEEARRLYSRSKAWLMTSRTEGLPGVALEAMACGAVMVSSDNDGSLEIIQDGENGLIVPQADQEAYLAAFARVCGDEDLRQRLSVGAIKTAADFSWQRAADRMMAFLGSLKPMPEESAR